MLQPCTSVLIFFCKLERAWNIVWSNVISFLLECRTFISKPCVINDGQKVDIFLLLELSIIKCEARFSVTVIVGIKVNFCGMWLSNLYITVNSMSSY